MGIHQRVSGSVPRAVPSIACDYQSFPFDYSQELPQVTFRLQQNLFMYPSRILVVNCTQYLVVKYTHENR